MKCGAVAVSLECGASRLVGTREKMRARKSEGVSVCAFVCRREPKKMWKCGAMTPQAPTATAPPPSEPSHCNSPVEPSSLAPESSRGHCLTVPLSLSICLYLYLSPLRLILSGCHAFCLSLPVCDSRSRSFSRSLFLPLSLSFFLFLSLSLSLSLSL